jgi:hypothetical protein
MQIPANSVVTIIVGDAQTVNGFSGGLNANDVLRAVAAYLNALGSYQIENTSASGDILSTVSPLIQETFQGTIRLQVFFATDTGAIASDVAIAFSEVTQQTPSQITIPSFTPPGGAAQGTGQAAATPTATQGIADSISNFFANITSTVKSLLIGLAAIIVLAMILIAYGPNIGRVAEAAL